MTKGEAVDALIEAFDGTPGQMRIRRSKKNRDALLAGDSQLIRSMYLGAYPKGEKCPKNVATAIKVLTNGKA